MSEQIETRNRDLEKVVCPYCGETNDLNESVMRDGENLEEWQCGDCSKVFDVVVHISVTVYAKARRASQETK